MQIGFVKGRFFDSSDAYGTSPSIIISQTMARQLLSGEDPIGKKLRLGEQHSVGTIVGIVNDIKMYYLREGLGWHIYVPSAQFPSRTFGFVVRSSGDPTIMATAIRDAIWAVDHDQPISSVEPLENLIATVNTGDRVVADLMVFFSVSHVSGGDRDLRRDGSSSFATHPRNRNPHGAGSKSAIRDAHGPQPRPEIGRAHV